MKRRDFIKEVGVGIGLLGAGNLIVPDISAQEKDYDVKSVATPVIDVHTHLPPNVDLERIIENFDRGGVEKAVVMARGGMSAEDTLHFYKKYPNRVVPFIPFQVKGWIKQEPHFLQDVEHKLKSGNFKGMGEVILRHYSVPQMGAGDFDIPADGYMMLEIMKFAAKYNAPVLVHMEAESGTITKFEKALNYEPNAKVILGHAGRATPEAIERLLSQYPNLYCDTAALDRTRPYGVEKNPISDESNMLRKEWVTLFTKFSDRFMLGIDGVFPPHYNNFAYVKAVMAQRELLAQLNPEVAKKIAYDNAKKLLKV